MKISAFSALLFSPLLIAQVTQAQDANTFLSRMTAAVGIRSATDPALTLTATSATCKLQVFALQPTGDLPMIDISLTNLSNHQHYDFRAMASELSNAKADFRSASATSTFNDDFSGSGVKLTQTLTVTDMPSSGLKGATLIIQDSKTGSYGCKF